MSDNKTQVDLYIGHGVVAHGVALVPGRAVVNGIFDGAIDSKELEIQTGGVVSGTTQAAAICVLTWLGSALTMTMASVLAAIASSMRLAI